MMRRYWALGLLLAGLSTIAGCFATARRGVPVDDPIPLTDPQVERGRVVFDRHCSMCHPGGAGGVAPAINNKPLPGALIKAQVRMGLGAMPAFGPEAISDEDLEAIVAYLEVLRAHPPEREAAPNP